MKNLIINIKILRLRMKKFLSKIDIYTYLYDFEKSKFEKGLFVYYNKSHSDLKHILSIRIK